MLTPYQLRWSYLLIFGLSFAAPFVWPHPGTAQVRDITAQARVHFERGNTLYESAMRARGARRTQRLEEALQAYVASLTIVRSRNVVFNAALTCEELGRLEEAFNYLAEYVTSEGLASSDVAEGQRRMTNLQSRVAVLTIESDPPGAEVRLDRLDLPSLGATPLQIAVQPGTHRIFLNAPHHESAMQPVSVEQGATAPITITLRPEPVLIRLEAPSGARLTIDATPVSSGITLRLAPGAHELRMELPGYEPINQRLELAPGEEERVITIEAPIPANERCRVTVETSVHALVLLDGRPRSEGRVHEFGASAGAHVLRVEAASHLPYADTLHLREGSPTHLQVDLAPEVSPSGLRRRRARVWSGVSTGILASGMTVAMFMAADAFDTWDVAATQYEVTHAEVDRLSAARAADDLDRANLIADVAISLTVAAAVTTIVLISMGEPEVDERESRVTISAAPTPDGAFLVATFPTDGRRQP